MNPVTKEDILEVLERIKLFNMYKEIATDMKSDAVVNKNKIDIDYIAGIEKKQGLLVSEIMNRIQSPTYFLFHQLYYAIQKCDFERAEQLKNRILNYGS